MSTYPVTAKNRVKRMPERGHYDAATIYPIVDQALICHVGFVQEGQPFVIPTLHARHEDEILLHGASTSRMLQHLQEGHPVCLTMTLVDGLVLAKSIFNHSINYRSAVIYGAGRLIDDPDEKMLALQRFTDKIMLGRWEDARLPTGPEFKATSIIAVTIEQASAKIRTGSPKDDKEDLDLPIWAGVVPLQQVIGQPIPASSTSEGVAMPDYLKRFVERG